MVADRGEGVTAMEPLVLSEGSRSRLELNDLAVELASSSAGSSRSLPPGVMRALADLVRSMNCYYSNLIEGHATHPVDIERAMRDEYSADREKRNLQLEAHAHVTVQQWLDGGGLSDREVLRPQGLREIHRRFCDLLPADLLMASPRRPAARSRSFREFLLRASSRSGTTQVVAGFVTDGHNVPVTHGQTGSHPSSSAVRPIATHTLTHWPVDADPFAGADSPNTGRGSRRPPSRADPFTVARRPNTRRTLTYFPARSDPFPVARSPITGSTLTHRPTRSHLSLIM